MKFSYTFLFLCLVTASFAQSGKIKGRVVGEQLENVPGAEIINLRTHQEVVADASGFYDINAAIGDTLTFKFIGYTQEKRVVVNIAKNINVLLIDKAVNDLGAIWTKKQWKKAEEAKNNYYKQLEKKADQLGKWNY